MSDYPTIKAADIRPGDTIQWTTLVCGISAKWKMTVSRIAAGTVGNTEFFKVYNQQGGSDDFAADDEFYLVDRPAPKLPTKPGSLVYVEELQGEKVDPPILAIITPTGDWVAGGRLPNGADWTPPGKITEWSEATVAKATP